MEHKEEYLLEIPNGIYVSIETPEQLKKWRQENHPIEGTLWTHDGYLVDESKFLGDLEMTVTD